MKIILLGELIPGPSRLGKLTPPIIGPTSIAISIVSWRTPDIPISFRIRPRRPRLQKLRVLIRRVIDHQVENHAHIAGMDLLDELLAILKRAIWFMDGLEIGDVIAHVHLRTFIMWRYPDHVYSEVVDVIELRYDSWDIADPVVVGVLERGWIDLVDDGLFPPFPVGRLASRGWHVSNGMHCASVCSHFGVSRSLMGSSRVLPDERALQFAAKALLAFWCRQPENRGMKIVETK
jgi:hypothetical protein